MAEKQARRDAVTARQAEARQRQHAESERARAEEQRPVADANFRMAQRAVDRYFTTVSDHELVHEAGMEPLRKSLLEAALEYYHNFTDQQADDPAVLGELAAAYSRVAQIDAVTGSAQWPTSWERYLDIVERLYKADVNPAIWAGKLEEYVGHDNGED